MHFADYINFVFFNALSSKRWGENKRNLILIIYSRRVQVTRVNGPFLGLKFPLFPPYRFIL